MNLYYYILWHVLGKPDADRVKREYYPPLHDAFFISALRATSSQLRQESIDTCVEVILGKRPELEAMLIDALYIGAWLSQCPEFYQHLKKHQTALEDYLLDPHNLAIWCSHAPTEYARTEDVREDRGCPIHLERILRNLGSERVSDARAYIATHAVDRMLRERIVKNAEGGY